jgi:D-alanine-D-alanine ligase
MGFEHQSMRVLIAYNEPVLPPAHPEAESEREVLAAVEAIADHLTLAGCAVGQMAVGADFGAVRESLRKRQPDVVFNLFEGLGDDPQSECVFAQVLSDECASYTGCSSHTLWRAGRKDLAKKLFRQAGLSTPDFFVVESLPPADFTIEWPAIVKPAFRDASIGIDQRSVVTDRAQLERQLSRVAREHGFPVLVEQFIRGREISVAIIGWPELRVLAPVETRFAGNHGDWPICTYNSKWDPDSRDYASTPLAYPADLTRSMVECLEDVARRAFRALGCHDFVTLDFRICPEGTPYLLEVNPNPGLKPTTCLTDLLHLAGTSYSDFLMNSVQAARARAQICNKGTGFEPQRTRRAQS